jgi:hypothetical protein
MRKTLRASVMVLALCCPAFAGDALCPPVVPPPAHSVQEPTTSGDMPNSATDSLTEIALDILAVMPSLL